MASSPLFMNTGTYVPTSPLAAQPSIDDLERYIDRAISLLNPEGPRSNINQFQVVYKFRLPDATVVTEDTIRELLMRYIKAGWSGLSIDVGNSSETAYHVTVRLTTDLTALSEPEGR